MKHRAPRIMAFNVTQLQGLGDRDFDRIWGGFGIFFGKMVEPIVVHPGKLTAGT